MNLRSYTNYEEYLASKQVQSTDAGFEVAEIDLHPALFDWQKACVRWALRKGRCALFEDCGLGKTLQQLEWSRHVCIYTGGSVLVIAPLAVAYQTIEEGKKIDLAVRYVKRQSEVTTPGIYVTNYDRFQEFDGGAWAGVVLDESDILRNYMGVTRRGLTTMFENTPYRLCCTATPAPNDHMELGNHSEFLSIMPANEMLARWFLNDSMHFGNYRLKGHAVKAFWEWVSSWAVCLGTPADIGYSADGYNLPELKTILHLVEADLTTNAGDGRLFREVELSATSIHREMRLTTGDRARQVAELVNNSTEAWLVGCNTNYEADALKAVIPDAVEVRGSHSIETKESRLLAFTRGDVRVMLSKPSIVGYGLNWQHCARLASVGMSYSFSSLYQWIRRCWRFGQSRPVEAHLVMAETEVPVWQAVQQKAEQHLQMQREMYGAVNSVSEVRRGMRLRLDCGDIPLQVPHWLREVAA